MNVKINLITYPDKLHNNADSVLLVSPSQPVMADFQSTILANAQDDLNVYAYESGEPVDWLLDVAAIVDMIIIDIDNVDLPERNLLSFLIAKSKTYWLTNVQDIVYNYISKQRIYNFKTIDKIGGTIVEASIEE